MAAPSPDRKEESTEPDDGLEPAPTTRPRRAGFAAFRRAFSRFASAFLILFLLAAAAFALSPGFREKVAGFVIAAFDREAPAPEPVPEEPQDTAGVTPRWLPEGTWELTYSRQIPGNAANKYIRSDDSFIYIEQIPTSATLAINTENAEVRNDIIVKGHSSIMSITEEAIVLVWTDEGAGVIYCVNVCGAPDLLDPAIVLHIAESLD